VYARRDMMAREETALAVLQRTALTFPKVDAGLELELLDCRYDLVLINRALKEQQSIHGANAVVEAFVVFKVSERRMGWTATGCSAPS